MWPFADHFIDLQHQLWMITLYDELHLAPVKEPQTVLDIGTGTGIWAIEFGLSIMLHLGQLLKIHQQTETRTPKSLAAISALFNRISTFPYEPPCIHWKTYTRLVSPQIANSKSTTSKMNGTTLQNLTSFMVVPS
jgi:hypothetical protein